MTYEHKTVTVDHRIDRRAVERSVREEGWELLLLVQGRALLRRAVGSSPSAAPAPRARRREAPAIRVEHPASPALPLEKRKNRVGLVYGCYTVMEEVLPPASYPSGQRHTRWRVRCRCGAEHIRLTPLLVRRPNYCPRCHSRHATLMTGGAADDSERHGKKKNRLGKEYGCYTVIGAAPSARSSSGASFTRWRVRCRCGAEAIRLSARLVQRPTRCRHCPQPLLRDGEFRRGAVKTPAMVGKKYGHLLVLATAGRKDYGYQHGLGKHRYRIPLVKVKCECGKIYIAHADHVRNRVNRCVDCGREHVAHRMRRERSYRLPSGKTIAEVAYEAGLPIGTVYRRWLRGWAVKDLGLPLQQGKARSPRGKSYDVPERRRLMTAT